MMTLSEQGKNLIKLFEGLKLKAYRDSAGVWTIGYGSTRYHDGRPVKPGDVLASQLQAAALFNNTLGEYISAVNQWVKIKPNQNQFDALVSFTYNEGIGAFQKSTLLKLLNAGNYFEAADQFLVWNKITDQATGKKIVLDALVKRREKERHLFLSTNINNQ